jgi:hypothetical protein
MELMKIARRVQRNLERVGVAATIETKGDLVFVRGLDSKGQPFPHSDRFAGLPGRGVGRGFGMGRGGSGQGFRAATENTSTPERGVRVLVGDELLSGCTVRRAQVAHEDPSKLDTRKTGICR